MVFGSGKSHRELTAGELEGLLRDGEALVVRAASALMGMSPEISVAALAVTASAAPTRRRSLNGRSLDTVVPLPVGWPEG